MVFPTTSKPIPLQNNEPILIMRREVMSPIAVQVVPLEFGVFFLFTKLSWPAGEGKADAEHYHYQLFLRFGNSDDDGKGKLDSVSLVSYTRTA
jgi:hypothetical protein